MVIIQPLEPCKNYTFDVAAMSKSGYLGPLAERNKATLESGEWCHRRKITGFMVYCSVFNGRKNNFLFLFFCIPKKERKKNSLKRWLDSRIETYWNPPFIDLITKKKKKRKKNTKIHLPNTIQYLSHVTTQTQRRRSQPSSPSPNRPRPRLVARTGRHHSRLHGRHLAVLDGVCRPLPCVLLRWRGK